MINDEPFYNTEEFKWLKIKSRQYVSEQMLPGVLYEDIKVSRDFAAKMNDELVYKINARILGKELPDVSVSQTEIFKTPKNPWQHFKEMYAEKWFMRWIVQRWPVSFIKRQMTLTATWKQWAVYPWIDKVPVTQGWQPVRILMPAKKQLTASDLEIE